MIAYDFLTEMHQFLVLDTETTCVDGQFHIIQLAIVPVIDGDVLDDPIHQYTTFVNPCVPIDEKSQRIHHITDEQVAGAPVFADIVYVLDEWFARRNAVFVAHNAGFDLTRLSEEYGRVGRPLFDVPILDTMHLPAALGYRLPEGGRNLEAVARAFGYTRPASEAHDATSDALLTARTLTGLLNYAASTKSIVDWEVLHRRAGGHTTATFTVPTAGSGSSRQYPKITPEHLATHKALPKKLAVTRADQWVNDVLKCADLGCPLLRAKCEAATLHAAILAPLLEQQLPTVTPGWKLNTFLPGYLTIRQYAIRMAAAPRWWSRHQHLQNLPVCDRDDPDAVLCPDCRAGNACPPDIAHQFLAVAAADAVGQPIPAQKASDLIRAQEFNQMDTWIKRGMPELAGYVAYLLVAQQEAGGNQNGASRVKSFARTLGLEKVEPRLALMVALDLYSSGNLIDLDVLVTAMAAKANTDPTYAELASWYLNVSHPRPPRTALTRTEPWSSRPSNRVTTTRFKI